MTTYMMAQTTGDYRLCHELLREEGIKHGSFTFPTIMAMDEEDTLVGLIGTHTSGKYVCAGPIALKSDRPRYWTLIRLVEKYEEVMRELGIGAYIFSIDLNDEKWLNRVKQFTGLEPYANSNGRAFFLRTL